MEMKTAAKIFYRILFTPEHIELWKQGYYTSCHYREIPDEWLEKLLDDSKNIDDYPLKTKNAHYRQSARDAFVEHCVLGGKDPDTLDDKLKSAISELSGFAPTITKRERTGTAASGQNLVIVSWRSMALRCASSSRRQTAAWLRR